LGDILEVKLMEIDDQGRLNFSHKATLPGVKPEDLIVKRPARPSRPGGGRPGGNDRGGRSGGDRGGRPDGRR